MTSSSRNVAVIDTSDAIVVTSAYRLQHFTREWIDSPLVWPERAIWFNDEDVETFCRILKIDSQELCEKFSVEYSQAKAMPNDDQGDQSGNSSGSFVTYEEYSLLKDEISELKKLIYSQQREINQLRDVCSGSIVNKQVFTVGSNGMLVTASALTQSMTLGFNVSGFENFVNRYYSFDKTFYRKTWKILTKPIQTQIKELIAFFVLYGLAREKKGQSPTPTELNNKYHALLLSFQQMLNNRKHTDKNKTEKRKDDSVVTVPKQSGSRGKKAKLVTLPDAFNHLEDYLSKAKDLNSSMFEQDESGYSGDQMNDSD